MTAKQNTDRSACRFVVLVYMTITETAQVQINNVVTLKILQSRTRRSLGGRCGRDRMDL